MVFTTKRAFLFLGALALAAAIVSGPLAQSQHARLMPAAKVPTASRTSLKGLIAFDRDRAIWVMRGDGTHRRQITHPRSPAYDFDPSLSPDGKSIVFRTSRGNYNAPRGIGAEGIFVVDIATGVEHPIQPSAGGLFPAWSPSGEWIAFSTPDGSRFDTIKLMKPDGAAVRPLNLPAGGNECATWSPDSSKLLFCHHDGDGNWAVWSVRADGSEARQLTHPRLTLPAGNGGDYPGAWSPDGRRVIYSAGRESQRDLFIMNADGSKPKRLLRWTGGDGAVGWLPNGDILFAHWPSTNARTADWYLIRQDGRRLRALPWLKGAGDPLDYLPPKS